jgi:catechol 2,3-dioxygenase-like lactoylglutathione lyase family enzyme
LPHSLEGKIAGVSSAPKSDGILETSLYIESVPKSVEFYERIFGFHVISDFGARGCAMQAGPHQVLLIFQKNGSKAISTPHHGDGELHIAFAIPASELPVWEAWLAENNIAIEERTTWKKGGQSLYFRDPDRHLLELATPGVWSNY